MRASLSHTQPKLPLWEYEELNMLLVGFALTSGTIIPCFCYLTSAVLLQNPKIWKIIQTFLPLVTKEWYFRRSQLGRLLASISFMFVTWYTLLGGYVVFASDGVLRYYEVRGQCVKSWDCYLLLPRNGTFDVNCTDVNADTWLKCFKLGPATNALSLELFTDSSWSNSVVWLASVGVFLAVVTLLLNHVSRKKGCLRYFTQTVLILFGFFLLAIEAYVTYLNCASELHIPISARVHIVCGGMICIEFGIAIAFSGYKRDVSVEMAAVQNTISQEEAAAQSNSVSQEVAAMESNLLPECEREIGLCCQTIIFISTASVFYLPMAIITAVSYTCRPY